jgi:serine/threonine-protein kinase
MIQLGAKADAVDRSLSQLRRQQEADGLGLRNDMEAADSRLRSYMQAANQDMQASRIAAASRNMDKAEAEIQVLEKFLGR